MKNLTAPFPYPCNLLHLAEHFAVGFRLLGRLRKVVAPALVLCASTGAWADSYYTNNASATYNVATYWNPIGVPTSTINADCDNGAFQCLILSTDPAWSTLDLRAGNGAGATGSFWQQGSTVNATGWFRMGVGSSTSAGTYSISGGTLNVNGTSMYMRIGELGFGTLNITNGAVNHTGTTPNPCIIGSRDTGNYGNSSSPGGVINQFGGTFTNNGELWVGEGGGTLTSGILGTYNLSGGIMAENSWLAIGRNWCNGTFNMTGGTLIKSANNTFTMAGIGTTQTATFNLSGGAFTNLAATWIGETGIGVFNLSGSGLAKLLACSVGYNGGTGYLNISGGSLICSLLNVGGNQSATSTSKGYVVQTGGTLTMTGGDDRIGGPYGTGDVNNIGIYSMSGGTTTIAGNFQVGAYGPGEMNLSGGMVTTTSGYPDVGRFTNSFGVLDISGGTFTNTTTGTKFIIGEQGTGTLNVRGGALVNGSTSAAGALLVGGSENTGGTVGIVNLLGGTLTTLNVGTGTSGSANVSSTFNFNGGTLQASGASAVFMTGLNNANVWPGGAVIDSQANAITIGQALITPPGNGVTSIPVATAGAGYVTAPIVKITSGGGTNATAIAVTNGAGGLASILITSPGVNYSSAPTVTLLGGGFTTAATIGTVTIGANASGGLTKNGSGTLTLPGVNTFTGNITVNGGLINFSNVNNLGTGTAITLNGGGLQYSNNSVDLSTRTITLNSGVCTIDTGSNIVTFANAIGNGGSGGLTKNGTGTLTLNAANAFTGNVNVNVGSLVINNSAALGTGAKTIQINNGTAGLDQLHLNGSSGAISLPANMAFQTSNVNVPGAIVNDAGNNVINGPITMTAGGGATLVTVTSGTLQLGGNITPNTTGRLLVLDGAGVGTVNGQVLDGGYFPGLTKNGTGIWTLNAVNTYSNATIINAGTLVLGAGASIANTASITVATNAVLDVSALSGGLVLNNYFSQALIGGGTVNGSVTAASGNVINPGGNNLAGTLTINNNLTLSGGVTNLIDLSNVTTVGGGVNDEIIVVGNLNLSGLNTFAINPTAGSLASGRYKLISYSGSLTGGATNFNYTFVTVPPRVIVTVDDSVANEIDLVITANPSSLVWQGDGLLNPWDAGITADWTNYLGASVFYTGDNVTLDDTSTNRTVNLVGTLVPGSVTINGTGNFTLAGTGKISAGTGLTMNDSGVLTIATTNSYTGLTMINNGTVVAGNGAALGSATGAAVITNGATLDVNNQNLGPKPVTVSGAGASGNGAIISSTGGTAGQLNALSSLTFAGNTTLGAIGGRFDVRPNPTVSFAANGYALTKTGTNAIYIVSAGQTRLGNVNVTSGTLGIQDSTDLGDPTKNLTISPGAGVTFWALAATNIPGKITTISGGQILSGSGSNNFAGPITMSGPNQLDAVSGTTLTLNGGISDDGTGSLIKTNTGTLVLAGINTYAAGTVVTAGTLMMGNGGPGTSLGTGPVTNGAVLQFNRSDNCVIANNIIDPGASGTLLKVNTNTVELQGINTYLSTATSAQVNGGTLQIDPTGSLLAGGQFWIAQNATTGACIINGGTLIVSNWIAVGRNNTNALGSLTLNSGSIQKYSANGNIILGSLGGNGTLTVNGGSLYDSTALLLAETANQGQGYFNLNGGLVEALSVVNYGGLAAVARFNGGTLQAITNNNAFMTGLSQALVQSGGAIIDDGGYTIAVNQPLLGDPTSPGGGLVKQDTGTLVLSGYSSTYTGGTVVSNGVLQLNQDAVLHLTFDQSNGNIVTNIGTGGSAMNGYIIGNGASIVSGGRYGKALSINGTGAGAFTNIVVITNNVVNNINGSGGNWTVGLWVNTSTAGSEYLFNGTTAYTWSNLETIFYLTSASSTAGTKAGMVRYAGGFDEGTAVLNNGAWHFVVITDNGGTVTQYVDGAADAWTVNGISATATGGMWVIGGSPDTGDGTAHFNGLIDEVYMFNRSLSAAEIQTLYSANNNLNPVLPTTTAVTLARNTSVLELNDVSQTIGSLTGPVGSSVIIGLNDALTVGNDNTSTSFPGVISGAGGLTKIGPGTFTLTADNTYSANTFVKAGTMVVDMGGIITNTAFDDVGQTTNDNATLTLQGGSSFTTTSDFNAGDVANSIGTVNVTGSSTLTANAMYVGSANAAASTATGTINQTNGTVTTLGGGDGVFVVAGRNAGSSLGVGNYNLYGGTLNVNDGGNAWIGGYGTGALNVSGGSATLSGFVSVGRFSGGIGSLNISSGSVSQTNAGRFTLIGEAGTGSLTLSGNGQFIGTGTQLALGWDATGIGTVNLNGGTLTVPMVVPGSGSGTFNFNGGTLMANAPSAAFMTGLTAANIQAGGAVINDGGFAITVGQPLLDGGTGGGLIKNGTGILTLSGLSTYTGNTVVSNGTMLVNGSIAGNTVVAAGTLGGTGTVGGALSLQSGATLKPSATLNTTAALTVNGSVTLSAGSVTSVQLNKGATPAQDQIISSGTINYSGTLAVTNLGAALAPNDSFQLFTASGHTGNFTTIAGDPGTGNLFSFDPATGILSVVSSVNQNPATANFQAVSTSGSLQFSWAPDHLGWQLYTNVVGLDATNSWFPLAGSGSVTNKNISIDPLNPYVFFQLRYP